MFWTGFAIGVAACIAIGIAGYFVRERQARARFVASLSPDDQEAFRGYELTNRDWRLFQRLHSS